MSQWPRRRTQAQRGLEEGYRSGLEVQIADQLKGKGIDPSVYETVAIPYTKPAKPSKYKPDFPLSNGVIIETKGRFLTADRQKHKLVKEQHPDLDIRFVFSNSKTRISKQSKTTYAAWCDSNGFKYADKYIPIAWLLEINHVSAAALARLQDNTSK